MIEADRLSKRFGDKLAVDGLTFSIRPGTVTGFLGPNGAGKSTTMRMILGRDRPTEGRTVVVSSHLMSEMEATADHVLVIGRGRLIADMTTAEFTALGSGAFVRVVSPGSDRLRPLLEDAGATRLRMQVRPGFGAAFGAEVHKLRTARAARRNLVLGTVLSIGLSALLAVVVSATFDEWSAAEQADMHLHPVAAGVVLVVWLLGSLAVADLVFSRRDA